VGLLSESQWGPVIGGAAGERPALPVVIEGTSSGFQHAFNEIADMLTGSVGDMVTNVLSGLTGLVSGLPSWLTGIIDTFTGGGEYTGHKDDGGTRVSVDGGGLYGGRGATYQQARPINVGINVHDNMIAGNGSFRALAIQIKDEFVSLGILGLN
jgi:hypothetical protein